MRLFIEFLLYFGIAFLAIFITWLIFGVDDE